MFSANSSQVSDSKLFVEDVFSTWLYTGNGSTQTITNGIDLAGKDGMVWIKNRTTSSDPLHYLNFKDGSDIVSNNSNNTSAKQVMTPYAAFNSDGFFVNALPGFLNNSGVNYASWTFREAPKFFDVVTYTGDGNYSTGASRAIPHSLGVQPGIVFIKRTDSTGEWWTAARRTGSTQWFGSTDSSTPFALNRTNAASTYNGTSQVYADATSFYPAWIGAGGSSGTTNNNGATYVAYLFAHDATSDGIIQCGSFTADGSGNATVNLGWEPQWVLTKDASNSGTFWDMFDNMRGFRVDGVAYLNPNNTDTEAEYLTQKYHYITNTGFGTTQRYANSTQIYVAIRRGPMRTPTLGTSVFFPSATTSSNPAGTVITTGFPVDMQWDTYRLVTDSSNTTVVDRLRGVSSTTASSGVNLVTSSTAAESTSRATTRNWGNTGYQLSSTYGGNGLIAHNFRRAPGFFDEVCYTGTGAARTVNHNLGVAPELMILKSRSGAGTLWYTYSSFLGIDKSVRLNEPDPAYSGFSGILNNTTPSATSFSLATNNSDTNGSGATYVAYLFASAPGVSKVGSYTGNGSSQTINCGFAAGARFILIKRTDSTGGWFVWDTARGIVAGNDPYLMLNSSVKEDTGADSVDTDSSGFVVNQVAGIDVNVSSATYIYLAIA